jgi:hypothetical protein
MPDRLIAVDWSGSKDEAKQRKTIWVADWRESSETLTLDSGRTTRKTIDYVLEAADASSRLVVGFDFAFSFPHDFADKLRCKTVEDLWTYVHQMGPAWLSGAWPEEFYVVGGRKEPAFFKDGSRQHLRIADSLCDAKSVFNLGAGGVGWGSVVGQPFLREMREKGFFIWPFHAPKNPLVIEIYPASYWRDMRRSKPEEREVTLQSDIFNWIPGGIKDTAIHSRDAFDALISLAAMRIYREGFASLEQIADPKIHLEGQIWQPEEASH